MSVRESDYGIHSVFINRWSPRAFTGECIDDQTLFCLFEAARWAPSSYNSQPWRYIYAKNDSPQWSDFLVLLSDFNRSWAKNASALIVALSKMVFTPPDAQAPMQMPSHAFDAGAAWQNLALQAHLLDWSAHALGGFDKQKTREILCIPQEFAIEAMIAIGKKTDKSILAEHLQEKEHPSQRKPISEWISHATFDFKE